MASEHFNLRSQDVFSRVFPTLREICRYVLSIEYLFTGDSR